MPVLRPTGGFRRAGVAGSTGRPRLNARLAHEAPSVRKQVPPATPARRRPLVGPSTVMRAARYRAQMPFLMMSAISATTCSESLPNGSWTPNRISREK
jgi:hypothetical protein